ncbi:succinate:quinone oxidoreductase [Acidilobus sp.]|uniref:succinate:quinone oxidoreductase n=1 Tax=Acidilobus sp. TaxID=1872109 RepID=UPI003CFFED72
MSGGKASSVQIWQYITAILLIGLLGFHLLERVPWIWGVSTMDQTLTAAFVHSDYVHFGWALLLLAYVALFHGLNGVRGMLLELRQGRLYTATINALFWIVFIVFAAIATLTVAKLPAYP